MHVFSQMILSGYSTLVFIFNKECSPLQAVTGKNYVVPHVTPKIRLKILKIILVNEKENILSP